MKELGRRWSSPSEAILCQIVEVAVTLVEHVLPTRPKAVTPNHFCVVWMLVVVPRRYPIDGTANVDGNSRIIVAVQIVVVMSVTIRHLADSRFRDFSSEFAVVGLLAGHYIANYT